MRLLLHCCCGPCTVGVVPVLILRGETVAAWFYNPNLAPEEEYRRRRETFLQAAAALTVSARAATEEPT